MIILTPEEKAKIELFDKIFSAIGTEQLKEIAESEQIVARLKGTENNTGLIGRLVNEHVIMHAEISTAKSDCMMLRNDVQTLAKLLLKPYDYNSQSDATNLKSRLGIY